MQNLVMDGRPPALKRESCSLPPRNSVRTRMSPQTESPAHHRPVAAPGRRFSLRGLCVGLCVCGRSFLGHQLTREDSPCEADPAHRLGGFDHRSVAAPSPPPTMREAT